MIPSITSQARFSRACMGALLLTLFLAPAALAQFPRPLNSPEVSADRHVTFRFRDPNAKVVKLALEGSQPVDMQKDAEGLWTVTIGPLEPDYYGYSFVADGVGLMDPSDPLMKPNLLMSTSQVYVPGPSTLPWQRNDVPHGIVHHHFYQSQVVGDARDFYVYTPPDYDPRGSKLYPVLYLLHGYSDGASAWTVIGRANQIFDNLIAEGKMKPMVVVMPLGYGAPAILHPSSGTFHNPALVQRNMDRFREALFQEVMPAVEKAYRVYTDRNSRAIAGLSMGGAESLYTGLNALDRFAWVGGFSSGGLGSDYDKIFPALDSKANAQLHLLWLSCGKDDRLLDPNMKFRDWLQSKGVKVDWVETPGVHQWQVWRRNLANFAPLLFQSN